MMKDKNLNGKTSHDRDHTKMNSDLGGEHGITSGAKIVASNADSSGDVTPINNSSTPTPLASQSKVSFGMN